MADEKKIRYNPMDRECPGCGRIMRFQETPCIIFDASGTADDEDLQGTHYEWSCPVCGIKYENGKWDVPEHKRPSEKQIRTILFINGRLGLDLEAPLTKRQAWIWTDRYFDEARSIGSAEYDDRGYDLQDAYGFSEGDFC